MTEHTISIIIPCKNRLQHLLQCLPTVIGQTYQDLQVIVVDFNCPEKTIDVVKERFKDKRIEVYKEPVPCGYWNLSESRNRGYLHSVGNKLLFLDADTILKPTFIEYAVKQLNNTTFVTGLIQPPWNGCGCLFVNRSDFEKVRGYNEALSGWGYEDIDIYKRLESIGLVRHSFDPKLIYNLNHSDEIRNTYHSKEDKYKTLDLNYKKSQSGEFKSRL